MTRIKDINTALTLFKDAASEQAQATESGDYKTANKCYSQIIRAATFLKNNNALNELNDLLLQESIGVRLWAACYLLSIDEKQAIIILESIAKTQGIHSLTAKTTLNEWRNGNLKL